jgi:hypothetical protein
LRYRSWVIFRFGSWYLPSSHGITIPRYSGSSPYAFCYTITGLSPSMVSLSSEIHLTQLGAIRVHTPHHYRVIPYSFGLTYSAFARRYLRNRNCFLFLRLLECFVSAGSCPQSGRKESLLYMMSHSGISGSTPTCSYPELIAACCALHQFTKPRHPLSSVSVLGHTKERALTESKPICSVSGPHTRTIAGGGLHASVSLRVYTPIRT